MEAKALPGSSVELSADGGELPITSNCRDIRTNVLEMQKAKSSRRVYVSVHEDVRGLARFLEALILLVV